MAFDKIIGQNRVKEFFQKAFTSGRLSHAYLFVGERGVGKVAMAVELAKALICPDGLNCQKGACTDCSRISKLNHPDVHLIFPAPAKIKEDEHQKIVASVAADPYQRLELWANPSISIERIRDVRHTSSFKSFEGKGRVEIIVDCERMTTEAANALLKILEEPPDKMFIIMISSRPSLLLPTIVSRCQSIKFDPLSVEDIETALQERNSVAEKQARLMARLAGGSYRHALDLLDDNLQEMQTKALELFRKSVQNEFTQILYIEDILQTVQRDQKKVKELLTLLIIWFRDALIFKETDGQTDDNLINLDELEVLSNFTKHFPNADMHSAVQEIEKALELMERNVQINLILIVLLNKLRNYIRR
ncbi:MAG: DNA polymerase III subunit delta' [bacterium]